MRRGRDGEEWVGSEFTTDDVDDEVERIVPSLESMSRSSRCDEFE